MPIRLSFNEHNLANQTQVKEVTQLLAIFTFIVIVVEKRPLDNELLKKLQ